MTVTLSPTLARCEPEHLPCPQCGRCARARAEPVEGQEAIDASVSLSRAGAWCPMFLDIHASALLVVLRGEAQ